MAAVVWLACYRDGCVRSPYSNEKRRARMFMPPSPTITHRLQSLGIVPENMMGALGRIGRGMSCLESYGLQDTLPESQVTIVALAKIVQGHHHGQRLHAWGEEDTLQRLLYNNPKDCYSLHIDDIRSLVRPHALEFKMG